MKEEFTKENKMRWLSRMFFSIADSPNHDVNPYDDIPAFLKGKVSSLDWGNNRKESKEIFCKKFITVLDLYDIQLSKDNILSVLENENQTNQEVVSRWADIATFPKN